MLVSAPTATNQEKTRDSMAFNIQTILLRYPTIVDYLCRLLELENHGTVQKLFTQQLARENIQTILLRYPTIVYC